jgi:hypothetical protein
MLGLPVGHAWEIQLSDALLYRAWGARVAGGRIEVSGQSLNLPGNFVSVIAFWL